MYKYKYEMHLHSCACSACAVSDAESIVQKAKELGYSGLVFTNHFFRGNTAVDRKLPYEEFCSRYEDDYLTAKKLGDETDIDVLFGIEEGYGNGKEVLIYGISPQTLSSQTDFLSMGMPEISEFVRSNGGICVCAHPFRDRRYITNPDLPPDASLFDGVEVYNYCNQPEENEKAADFAEKVGLLRISGGDVHNTDILGMAGLAFSERIHDNTALVKAIKSRDYRLIIDGKIGAE